MGQGHSHSHRAVDVETSRPITRLLLIFLALTAVATLIGLGVLWPSGDRPPTPYSADGVTYPEGEVLRVGEACPVVTEESTEFPEICDDIDVRLDDDAGTVTELRVRPGVVDVAQVGDRVTLVAIPGEGADGPDFGWVGFDRKPPLGWLALVFLLVVALIARVRGLLAILGLGFAGLVIGYFMLPALLAGESGLAVALVGSSAIMFVVLYLAHGPSVRTSTALAGTLIGLAITAGIGLVAIQTARAQRPRRRVEPPAAQPGRPARLPWAAHLRGDRRRTRSPQRRHHHPELVGVGAQGGRAAPDQAADLRLGHADRARSHRLHDLHHRLRLRRHRHRDDALDLAVRPPADRRPQ